MKETNDVSRYYDSNSEEYTTLASWRVMDLHRCLISLPHIVFTCHLVRGSECLSWGLLLNRCWLSSSSSVTISSLEFFILGLSAPRTSWMLLLLSLPWLLIGWVISKRDRTISSWGSVYFHRSSIILPNVLFTAHLTGLPIDSLRLSGNWNMLDGSFSLLNTERSWGRSSSWLLRGLIPS